MTTGILREQLKGLPLGPGVYLFKDAEGEVVYVGKAKSLRSRVRSYFGREATKSLKLTQLQGRIHEIETIVTNSEAEALLLESNLIKEYSPRFNIQLRDDKSFPYVKVTVNEAFPRIHVTRRVDRDGARYFGPFTDVGAMRRALRMIKRMYTVRSCHYDLVTSFPPRPCLDYHIDRCKAPCVGYQSRREYRQMIDEIVQVLSGHTGDLKRSVRTRMRDAADALEFEKAGELRDVLRGLESLARRQIAVDFRGGDRDVIGVAAAADSAAIVILRVRDGRLLGRQVHFMANVEDSQLPEMVQAAVRGFYLRQEDLPPELLVGVDFEDREVMEAVLAERRGRAFAVTVPVRGKKRRLVELACRNAEHILTERKALDRAADQIGAEVGATAGIPPAARSLMHALELPAPPHTIVCFDISTLGGTSSVGSAVWLEDGRPRKGEYRKFRVRGTPEGQIDDYSMMQEVVGRYFNRRVAESARLPDLILIDGGKGQLGAALQAMESAGVSDIPVAALAKREEEIFLPGRQISVRLPKNDPALHWLQRARDEAHRFAVTYHRSLRRRRTLRSGLGDVPGVGPAREKELLTKFGSVVAIRRSSAEELMEISGIGRVTAERILAVLGEDSGA